jgi:hypothetical protein
MVAGKEKTPRQIWEDAVADLSVRQAKYDAMTDRIKTMASGIKAWGKIEELKFKVAELAINKDDEPLSKTAKSYLKRYYAYLKYGKWSASLDKGNKYVNKGKLGEQDSITLCSFLDDRPYYKNPERFDDEYLTGEPDIIFFEEDGPYIIDVKTSWDIETFMECLGKDLNPLYWWQIHGYFALTGAKRGEVSYCLVNTPEPVLKGEKYGLMRRLDVATDENPEYKAAEKVLINNMTFTDMPHADRRIKFTVERDDEAIAKIYQRVKKCREYLAEIQELHAIGTFKAKSGNEEMIEEAA